MRTSLASALSVAGVVAAGAAAFALNTAVLTTGATGAGTIAPTTLPTATETGFVAPGSPSGGSASAAGSDSVIPPENQTGDALTPESTQVAATLTTYKVGTAGSVVLDSADGTLTVKNIVPAAGWTSEPARTDTDGGVRVHFVKGSSRLEFIARITSGKVVVEVNNESAPAAATRPPRSDDDERDYEYDNHEDDDHEDGEHERGEWHDDDDD
jgi:hypothetical protein